MKERVDSQTKIWRDQTGTPNGPTSQEMTVPGSKMDAEVKAEVKEEDGGRKSTDSRPPSRKLNNGDADIGISIKSEDNNNKRIKLDKKAVDSIKTENGKPGSVGSDTQKASPASSTTPQLPASGSNTPASAMCPTPGGNIVTSNEPPFMQQQSEIFVFSTSLANQAADNVRMGACKTIIQFHMEHPNTKAFLQKNPLKSNNFRSGAMKMLNPNAPGMMRMQQPGPGGPHMPPSGSWGPNGPGMVGPMDDPSMMGCPGMMGPGHPSCPPNGMGNRGSMMGGPGGWGPGGPQGHPMGGPGSYPGGPMMEMEDYSMMGPGNMMGGGPMNISASQVPDENLTSEQRQHRSKGLAQLTKIHQMLMGGPGTPEGNPQGQMIGPDGRPTGPAGPGMYPGGMGHPGMMSQQQQQAMMQQGGMMHPHGMMSPQQQHMMQGMQGMAQYGPRGPPGMNGKEQFHAQREWFQIQQEYFMEKQRMQHMRGGGPPGTGPAGMEPGPPPSYYSSISRKHGGMTSPTSPSMNGMRMPMPGPHGMMDPEGMAMYGPGGPSPHPDMCGRGPHTHPPMGMDPMGPGMPGGPHGYPPHHPHHPHSHPHHGGMPPQGPMDPGFDPTMAGAMPPAGMMSPSGQRHPISMGPGGPHPHHPHSHPHPHPHMMGPNGMIGGHPPGHTKTPTQVTLHRAGNPEQFNPETMGGVIPPIIPPTSSTGANTASSKPPPSYAQAQKRKRGAASSVSDELDEYGKGSLQQTPSPTKIQYHLNQFEGQELTITKQLNAAYVAGNGGDDGSGMFNPNSPLHGPGSNKAMAGPMGGPLSNSSQVSNHLSSPPVTSSSCPLSSSTPASSLSSSLSSSASLSSSTVAGANMRLSHFDPSPIMANGLANDPHHPANAKSSSLSNITSASLANLAKGVENLSNQMQQNMMQGGPFHSIQVQGQMANVGNNGNVGTTTTNNNNTNSNSNAGTANPGVNNNNMNNNTAASIAVSSSSTSSAITTPITTTSTSIPVPSPGNINANIASLASSSSSSSSSSLAAAASTASTMSTSSSLSSSSSNTNNSVPPSVNNTYIATNMSISQVNVQNHPGMNSYVNMQMQNMSNSSGPEMGGVGLGNGGALPSMGSMVGQRGPGVPGGPMPHHHPHHHHHHQMSQAQAMMAGNPAMQQPPHHPSPQVMMQQQQQQQSMQPAMPPMSAKGPNNPSNQQPYANPHMNMNQTMNMNPGSQPPAGPGGVTSPQFPPASSSTPTNANSSGVQIQQKGHNTIQYLPANPPSSGPNGGKGSHSGGQPRGPADIDYSGMPRFPSPSPHHPGAMPTMDPKGQSMSQPGPLNSTLQYFPNSSPNNVPGGPMSGPRPQTAMAMANNSLVASMGPEFANQATIAMHQSAAMRSPSLTDLPGASGGPTVPGAMPPSSSMGSGGPGPGPMMESMSHPSHPHQPHPHPSHPHHHGIPPNSMGGGPSPMMGEPSMMAGGGMMQHSMRPRHSPGVMRQMPPHPVMGTSGSLECVSPIPGMGGSYMSNGPSIEQAQAQAQAHAAAMMMQGGSTTPTPTNPVMPGSSPHAPTTSMTPGPPHTPTMPSMHAGPQLPPGSSPHPHTHPAPPPGSMASVSSPHGPVMPTGASPMGPGSGPSPHMGGPSPHSAMPMMGGPIHGGPAMGGPGVPPGSTMPQRHPGMGTMRMPVPHSSMTPSGGPVMGPGGPPGQYGSMPQYPQQYPQPDYYHHPQQARAGPPRQMMPAMMGGGAPGPAGPHYGMMPNMPGPS